MSERTVKQRLNVTSAVPELRVARRRIAALLLGTARGAVLVVDKLEEKEVKDDDQPAYRRPE